MMGMNCPSEPGVWGCPILVAMSLERELYDGARLMFFDTALFSCSPIGPYSCYGLQGWQGGGLSPPCQNKGILCLDLPLDLGLYTNSPKKSRCFVRQIYEMLLTDGDKSAIISVEGTSEGTSYIQFFAMTPLDTNNQRSVLCTQKTRQIASRSD